MEWGPWAERADVVGPLAVDGKGLISGTKAGWPSWL